MSRIIRFLLFGVIAALAISGSGFAGGSPIVGNPVQDPREYVQDQLLVRFKPGTPAGAMATAHGAVGAMTVRTFKIVSYLYLVQLPPGLSVKEAIALYQQNKNVLYAEPNLILRTAATYPGDAMFNELWGLHNTGQGGGTVDADIDAPEAWDNTTGSSSVVVAVIDTGIDYHHEDLAANMWQNTADCNSNGLDDDGNGYSDDCYGIDTYNGDSDPMDDNAHGTHVAGTIGARGGNEIGVVGVNWAVSLMACKFLSEWGWGTLDGAIACLEYVQVMKDRGVNIVATNNSWGGWGFAQALFDAIAVHLNRGILFVAAAGNWREDHDAAPDSFAPSGYYLPNILAVAATTRYDTLAFFSDYGRRTVHLGAPGDEILSTVPGNDYDSFSGTSMAAPHVAGVAALLKAQNPSRDWIAIKNLILAGGDTLADTTITRKRLNAYGSLNCSSSTIRRRLRPTQDEIVAVAEAPLNLSVLHINCANPNGNVAVTVNPGGATVILQDNGAGFDQVAGDGIYSGQWTPPSGGRYTLSYPDGDGVTVTVLSSYSHAPAAFNWRDITATGIGLNLGDDSSAMITSPFPVLFGGFGSFDHLFVGSNGHINFTYHSFWNFNLPLPSPFHATLVAPFWDDLFPTPGSFRNVFVAVRGSAPNRELVIEWRNVSHFDCPHRETDTVTFQVIFFEGRGDILFQYADTIMGGGACAASNLGASATVGIQIAPMSATQFSFNSPVLPNNTAILWTTSAPAAGCSEVTATSSPATVRYTRANQIANIRVTVRNNRASSVRLESIAPQADERFTVLRISPRLPLTLRPRRSQTLIVQTRGPATGPFPVVATRPYFDMALDCGTLTTASDRRRLVPLYFAGLQTDLRNGYLHLEAQGTGIAAIRLELFDLAGQRLLERTGDGSALTVPLERETGRRLANGVYLYIVTVQNRDGAVWRSEVRKLIVR